jgi:hypothetical protein
MIDAHAHPAGIRGKIIFRKARSSRVHDQKVIGPGLFRMTLRRYSRP